MIKSGLQLAGISCLLFSIPVLAQPTFPVNEIADPLQGHYVFINATVVKDISTKLMYAPW